MRNGTKILKPKGKDGKDLDEKEIEKIIPNRIERERLVEERDLENFLNEVQAVCILINHDILEPEFAEPGFSWVIQRVTENREIMDYIKYAQENNYGYYSWGEISMYAKKKFKRADEYDEKIGFKGKSS